jgi:hypothetical protein
MPAFIRRYRWYMFAACAIFLLSRAAFLQGRPERLRDLPSQGEWLLGIHRGVAYFQMHASQTNSAIFTTDSTGRVVNMAPLPLVVRAFPVEGNSSSLLFEDQRVATLFRQIQLTDNGVHFVSYPDKTPRTLPYSLTSEVRTSGRPIRQKQTTYLPVELADFYLVPFSGGATAPVHLTSRLIVRSDSGGKSVGVTNNRIYWIEIESNKRTGQASGSLKALSLHGGSPETLQTGLPPQTSLYVSESSQEAAWMFVPVGAGRHNLYRLTEIERNPQLFLQNTELNTITFQPATYNGRVYWKRDSVASIQASDSVYQSEILSAALDGTDTRSVHTFSEPDTISALYAHAGKLYIEMPKANSRHLLRLEPGPPAIWRAVLRFPSNAQQPVFDGDYFYYALIEERESFWDKARRYRRPGRATVLYRYRLPR